MKSNEKKARILFLCQWYHTSGSKSQGTIFMNLAEEFQRRGYEVEVLTAFPYFRDENKVLPGYKGKLRSREKVNGIDVVRLPLYINQSKSGLKRMLCYTSFGLSAMTIGQFGIRRPDVVFCYNLPTFGWAARLFRFFRGAKVVYMIQDLWPESVAESGMFTRGRFLNRILQNWCDRFYRSADRLTALSPGMKANLCTRGIPEEKIEVLYNWTEESASRPEPKVRKESEPFVVSYAGNIGSVQGLDVVLDAAKLALERNINVQFRLVGGGVDLERLQNRTKEMNLTNVVFVPHLSGDEYRAELSRADVLLVHLINRKLFEITIPSKTQAYLFAGKPILCGLTGDGARLVQEADAGVIFEQENAKSLIRAVEKLSVLPNEELQAMGNRGRTFYQERLSLRSACEKLSHIFKELCDENRGERHSGQLRRRSDRFEGILSLRSRKRH